MNFLEQTNYPYSTVYGIAPSVPFEPRILIFSTATLTPFFMIQKKRVLFIIHEKSYLKILEKGP